MMAQCKEKLNMWFMELIMQRTIEKIRKDMRT